MNAGVSKFKEEALKNKMRKLGIRKEDIEEKFIRARGRGGQRLNKVSTCVYLKHLPTKIEVKCQKERSQALNRFFARRILANKIEARLLKKLSQEQKRIEKMRRQKRKRSKRAREKILKDKRRTSEKKKARSYRLKLDELVA